MKTVRILFLGGAKRVSLAERFFTAGRSLRRRVCVFSYELTKDVPIASIAHIVVGRRWDDPKIFHNLLAVCKHHRIDIVLPFVDPAIAIAAALKLQEKTLFIPVSSPSCCEIFFDKKKTARWCQEHRIPAPPLVRTAPCIAKPVFGSASRGIVRLATKRDYNHFVRTHDFSQYILQRIIIGGEFTIDCYVSPDGKILAAVPRQRLEVTAGEVTKTLVVPDRDLITFANRVLTNAELRGPVTLQVIREHRKRKLALIEANPRFGGGVIATIEAGVDIPKMVLKDFLKKPNAPVRQWRSGLLMMRAYREHFSYANHH